MESKTVLIRILASLVFGIALGLVTIPLSKKLTLSRTDDPGKAAPLTTAPLRIVAIVAGIFASAGVIFTADDYALMIRNLLLLVPIFSISFVDALVRKIPNPLLLTMLGIEAVYVVYVCISTKSLEIIPKMFVGLFLGFIVCTIPSLLKIPMGAGDIKYSGVIGICLYAMGYFQAMILMALLVMLFYIYLKVTKKGGMKTLVPMGPFLSIGTVITMCVSVFGFVERYSSSLF